MRTPRNWHKEHKANLSLGDRAADRLRNGMGSWPFVLGFMLFLAGWAAANTIGSWGHWDEYPFILLNLFLSMLAALQGAILLISARRADAVSAAMARHDYETNVEAEKEIEELMAMNREQLEIIKQLRETIEGKIGK